MFGYNFSVFDRIKKNLEVDKIALRHLYLDINVFISEFVEILSMQEACRNAKHKSESIYARGGGGGGPGGFWGGGGGIPGNSWWECASWFFKSSDPISDQKMSFFTAVFRPGLWENMSSLRTLEIRVSQNLVKSKGMPIKCQGWNGRELE